MIISYSFGIIDILHYGHIHALTIASENADKHIFGLVSDDAVLSFMGTLVSNYEERLKVLTQVRCVDEIVYQETFDPIENIKEIHSRYPKAEITVYHGNNWKFLPAEEYIRSINGKSILTEYYQKMTPESILKILTEQKQSRVPVNNLISTKANTLLSLSKHLKKSYIEDILVITGQKFAIEQDSILKEISRKFNGDNVVIRSSSSNEDCYENSNAGHYESVLNVASSSLKEIEDAIWRVLSSYGLDIEDVGKEQVLIQRQTIDCCISGVLFTRDIHENRPYYLINYDENGSTDSVTSGRGGKLLWIAKDINITTLKEEWHLLIVAVQEIEMLLSEMVLDIEFAITREKKIVIFQVRPLAANYRFYKSVNDSDFFELKAEIKDNYSRLFVSQAEMPLILSDMAFWNPAEIIGTNPRPLDYSLYREIVTRKAWNNGLTDMGYQKVPHELMYKVGNKPYVSLEYSFNTLIPSTIEERLTKKLKIFYYEKLKRDLTAHDKIEFEIVYSCFDFETNNRILELLEAGFTLEEVEKIIKSLRIMTFKNIKEYSSFLAKDKESLKILASSREAVERKIKFNYDNVTILVEMFRTLIVDISEYGTPQFSRQARYAFISQSFCKSLTKRGYILEHEMDQFMASVRTVASEFEEDFFRYMTGEMCRAEFNKKYGHLRSGTYDIRTDRYDKLQFNHSSASSQNTIKRPKTKEISVHHNLDLTKLNLALKNNKMDIDGELFRSFLKESLEQREYFKFEFTKSLSLALEILIQMGGLLGINRDELSYLEVPDILASEYYRSVNEIKKFWMTIIKQRQIEYKKYSKVVLPGVILDKTCFNFIQFDESRPNFITRKILSGDVVILEKDTSEEIDGKIVIIEKADPGYDWIFSHNIIGLITKYGGVASHMAIRCAEFGIPAAIGCGERIFDYICGQKTIQLDCLNGKIN